MEPAKKPTDKPSNAERTLEFLKTHGREGCARGEIVRKLNLSENEAATAFKKLVEAHKCFTTDVRRAGSIVYFAAEAFPEVTPEEMDRRKEESPRKKLIAAGKTFQEKGEAFTFVALKELTGASQSAIYEYINLILDDESAVRVRTGVYRFKKVKGETEVKDVTPPATEVPPAAPKVPSAPPAQESPETPAALPTPAPVADAAPVAVETPKVAGGDYLAGFKEGFAAGFKEGWEQRGKHGG